MFIEAEKLINLPVAAADEQSKIGEIADIIIEPENGRVLGFLVKTGGIFGATKALSIVDIKDWDPNGIVTSSIDNLVSPDNIVRIKEVLDRHITILNMKAKTEAGKSLGKVENFLIDTETEMVAKYYLRDLLGNARVFPAETVVSIDKDITFADDVAEVPPGAAGAVA